MQPLSLNLPRSSAPALPRFFLARLLLPSGVSEASRPANPFANAVDTDLAYRDAVEARRATSLRRRVMWCCILGMFLTLIGVLGHGMELLGLRMEAGPKAAEEAALAAELAARGGGATVEHVKRWTGLFPSTITHFTSTTLVLGLCVWVLIYTARTKPFSESEAARAGPNVNSGRKRLVFALTTLALGEILILVPAEIIAQNLDFYHGPLDAVQKVNEEPDRGGYTAANAFGMFYLLACVFVPMRWKESLRIALPGLAVLAGSVMFLPVLGWQPIVGFMLLALSYTVISTGWSAWRYADFDARLRAHGLGARYADLSEQVSSISAELQEARRLHESLFPALAVLQGHPDTPVRVGFRYEPARQIGGDFLDVYREPPLPANATSATTDKNGGVTVVVIDVSGHGVTAALAVNRLHGELRRFFARYPRAEQATGGQTPPSGGPGHLLSELNVYTCAALAEQGVFATAIALHIAPRPDGSALIRWANAGHPTAFLAGQGHAIADLNSTATMLGVLPPDLFEAHEQSVEMPAGARLVTYTDGAVESRDAHGQDYTAERLRERIRELVDSGTSELLDPLMDSVRAHRHGRITDDTLLVDLRIGPKHT